MLIIGFNIFKLKLLKQTYIMSYYTAMKNMYFLNNVFSLNKQLESQRELHFNTGFPPCLTSNNHSCFAFLSLNYFIWKVGIKKQSCELIWDWMRMIRGKCSINDKVTFYWAFTIILRSNHVLFKNGQQITISYG